MADIKKIKDKIASTIYPNGKGAINATDHQAMLLEMADGMAETDTKLTELSAEINKIDGGEILVNANTSQYVPYAITKGETYLLRVLTAGTATLVFRKNNSSEGQQVVVYMSSKKDTIVVAENDYDSLYIYFNEQTLPSVEFSFKLIGSYIETFSNDINAVKTQLLPLNNADIVATFNGSTSVCDITDIQLSKDGDYIEIDVLPDLVGPVNGRYGLCYGLKTTSISLGCSKNRVDVRASDSTWICLDKEIPENSRFLFGVHFRNGNIDVEVNKQVVSTYIGQKPIVIGGFGLAQSVSSYWKGQIASLVINGVTYKTIADLGGYTSTDVEMSAPNGALTKEQAAALNVNENKEFYIYPTSEKVGVYFRLHSNVYGFLEIKHSVNHTDNDGQNGYCDLWGLFSNGGMYVRDNGGFSAIANTKLLVASENESTIQFKGMEDFTGGYHGDERIDLSAEDYVEFVVDGKSYSIADLVQLGNVGCSSFFYRQKSTLYASYVYNPSHLKLGKHFKETHFDKGYTTRNFVKLDLSALGVNSLEVITAFTGLVCVHENMAKRIYGDDGSVYIATNPSVSVPLVNEINTYCRKVVMENGDYSCVVDSQLIGTSVSEWKDPKINVQIMDRADDSKYYSYLPSNIVMKDGDFVATECAVRYNANL